MSDHRQGAIWIFAGNLERLFSARHVCYLIGSYDGSGNYGDILQLHANARRIQAAGSGILAAPLVYWRYVNDHLSLRDRHPELFGQRFSNLGFGDKSHSLGDLPDNLPGTLLLLFKNVPKVVLGKIPQVDQNLSEFTLGH